MVEVLEAITDIESRCRIRDSMGPRGRVHRDRGHRRHPSALRPLRTPLPGQVRTLPLLLDQPSAGSVHEGSHCVSLIGLTFRLGCEGLSYRARADPSAARARGLQCSQRQPFLYAQVSRRPWLSVVCEPWTEQYSPAR